MFMELHISAKEELTICKNESDAILEKIMSMFLGLEVLDVASFRVRLESDA